MSEGTLHVIDSRTFKSYDIPIHRNTIRATDFQAVKGPEEGSDLADQVANGLHLYDPGYRNTAVAESKITYLDGQSGIMQYRGHNVAEFWDTADFEDVAYLLTWGDWPTSEQRETFRKDIYKAMKEVPSSVIQVIRSFPKQAAPMHMVIAGLAAYAGEHPDRIPANAGGNIHVGAIELVDTAIPRTLANFAVCVALASCHRDDIDLMPPEESGSFLYNTILMMGKVDPLTGKPDPQVLYHMRRFWALGADLGHTNSTAAFLHGASTLGDPLSCLISALSSGYGILHFGAAEASYKNLAAIGDKKNVPRVIEQVKKGNIRLFGYGHRMFKTSDPRIPLAAQILREIGSKHPLLEVAMEIDRIACQDTYFTSRNLQANSDLYIGILYTALDFEPSFAPVLIALMRSGGMLAHWREAMCQAKPTIWRPVQFYMGTVGPKPVDASDARASDWSSARAAGKFESLAATSNPVDIPAMKSSTLTNGMTTSLVGKENTAGSALGDEVLTDAKTDIIEEKEENGQMNNAIEELENEMEKRDRQPKVVSEDAETLASALAA